MASEKGSAQTGVTQWCADLCGTGVVRRDRALHWPNGVTNLVVSRTLQERGTVEGDSPVGENFQAPVTDLEYHGTREILWEAGRTTSQG